MSLETGTYIADLVNTNPGSNDPKSQGDDHLRLIKLILQNTFAGIPGMVIVTGVEAQGATASDYTISVAPAPSAYTASMIVICKSSHTNTGSATIQINSIGTKDLLAVDGSALNPGDIGNGEFMAVYYDGTSFYLMSGNDRANRNGETYGGTHDMTNAVLNVATNPLNDNSVKVINSAWLLNYLNNLPQASTPSIGDNSTRIATTAFVVQQAFLAALPAQPGGVEKYSLNSVGGVASWGLPFRIRLPRTSNIAFSANDSGKFIDITSGTFTQTFGTAASLGNGWFCYVRNNGNGVITLDPNGSETINGIATLVARPGMSFMIQCDGTAFYSIPMPSMTASEVYVTSPNSNGSTNQYIGRYTVVQLNTGNDITYVDDAALGAKFTINTPGLYEMEMTGNGGGGGNYYLGISINSTQLNTSIYSINAANRLCVAQGGGGGEFSNVTALTFLNTGDVLRPHYGSNIPGGYSDAACYCRIRKVNIL